MCDMRIIEAAPGSPEELHFEKLLRRCDQRLGSLDLTSNNIDGKGSGHLIRLVGALSVIYQATEDVEVILGSEPLNGVDE